MSQHLQDWFYLAPWVLWLTGVVLALIIELLQRDRRGLAAAGGCAAGAITAVLAPGLWWLAFAVAAIGTVSVWVMVRPVRSL